MLSQEHTPSDGSFRAQQAEGAGVEPARPVKAPTVSNRFPSPGRVARPYQGSGGRAQEAVRPALLTPDPSLLTPEVVPGGIEPPISSVSGRRRRRWATGSNRQCFGQDSNLERRVRSAA